MSVPKPVTKSVSNEPIKSFEQLIENTNQFGVKIPTNENLISVIAGNDANKQLQIVHHANRTRIVIHHRVVELIDDFLKVKTIYGSSIEKDLYKSTSREQFIQRLFIKRPLAFIGPHDNSLLRDYTKIADGKDWELVGTDVEGDIKLKDYLSYDEMQISSLLGASTPTFFINDGSRINSAKKGNNGSFQPYGIIVGLVGARFAKYGKMEYQHIMCLPLLNTETKGFGEHETEQTSGQSKTLMSKLSNFFTKPRNNESIQRKKLLDIWAKFYQIKYFPTYQEHKSNFNIQTSTEKYLDLGQIGHDATEDNHAYFNISIYKKRVEITAETLLLEANERGKEENRKCFVHVVGFGLGVWQIAHSQPKWFVQVFADSLNKLYLPWISTLHFSWFPPEIVSCGQTENGQVFCGNENNIKIEFSKRNTADKLTTDELLVTSYAWDGNSFPGNEYWHGSLWTSSDPAAACCSTIPQLQNPYINPFHLNIKVL